MASSSHGSRGGQKRKHLSSTSPDASTTDVDEETQQREAARLEEFRSYLEELERNFTYERPDERQEISKELESGSHVLIFEHNNSTSAKCRANKCRVQDLKPSQQFDERIRAPYRFNLQAKNPDYRHWSELDKPNRRFFHVSCLESIGVDLARHVTLPPERVVTFRGPHLSISQQNIHPAIFDWVEHKGKAFDAALYGPEFKEALKSYESAINSVLMRHGFSCGEKCICGRALEALERPKSNQFIQGEPTERTLTNVLIHVIGAEHLGSALTEDVKIVLLEIYGQLPETLTKEALAARKANGDGEVSIDETEKTEKSEIVEPSQDSEPSKDNELPNEGAREA